eukprot:1105210-Rhodomonas_salina.6
MAASCSGDMFFISAAAFCAMAASNPSGGAMPGGAILAAPHSSQHQTSHSTEVSRAHLCSHRHHRVERVGIHL